MNVKQVIPRDAIPSINDPRFDDEYIGDENDDVIVVEGEPTRAYPVRILNYHEIVNDVVDGDAIAVTWCPLCGSAVVYERDLGDRTLTFGVSGKLADDDLVMYDRETESEWKQSLGECIVGDLRGTTLDVRPAAVMPWSRFRENYPDGIVLQPTSMESEAASETDSPDSIDYSMEPYEAYFETEGFGLAAHRGTSNGRSWERDDLDPKAVVLGVELDGEAVGFPLSRIEAAGGVVTATVGDMDIVVFAGEEGIHAFENPGFEFQVSENEIIADATTWDGATGESVDGRQLTRVPARRLFAFAWQDDHGSEAFYQPQS